MTVIISFLLKLLSVSILLSGAVVASQKTIGASEILLISLAISILGDFVHSLGRKNGKDSREEPTLPGSGQV